MARRKRRGAAWPRGRNVGRTEGYQATSYTSVGGAVHYPHKPGEDAKPDQHLFAEAPRHLGHVHPDPPEDAPTDDSQQPTSHQPGPGLPGPGAQQDTEREHTWHAHGSPGDPEMAERHPEEHDVGRPWRSRRPRK
ncbi:MAG TPA: hypothetical protein VIN09_10770 [Chloroflexota bacterium]